MRELKRYLLPILGFVFLSFLLSYKLFSSFNFHPDFARDVYDILAIVQGKLTLIGPKLSFGGIFSGPYYYYLLAPVFFLTGGNLDSLLVSNLLLFIAGAMFFYSVISRKYPAHLSVLASLVLALLPIYITGARGPWNASTYLPLFMAYLSLVFLVDMKDKKWLIALTGFLGGVVATIHLVTLPVLAIGIVYLFIVLKKKSDILFFLGGFSIAFAPLILFEVKHGFVMTKNTLLVGSYKTFMENGNMPNAESGRVDFFENVAFLAEKIKMQLGLSPVVYAAAMAWLFGRSKSAERFLIVASFVLFVFYAAVLKYQFGNHYLYPVSFFIIFSQVAVVLKLNYKWVLALLIFIQLLAFPFGSYNPATRTASTYKKRVEYTLEKGLVRKGESFNIIQVSKDYLGFVPVGHEYRFFFRKTGLIPKSEFEYNQSDKLLIYVEVPKFDISALDSWEMNEFGKEHLKNAKAYSLDMATLYVLDKNK